MPSHGHGRRAWTLVGALVLAAACRTEPATQVIVVIATDIPVATMDGFSTRVLDGSGELALERSFDLGAGEAGAQLPADYAIGPKGGDPRRKVTVEVDARSGDRVLFTTRAVTSFREARSLRLDMFLASRCLDEATTCDADERCTEEGCVPIEIDPDDLPPFVEGASAVDAPWVRTLTGDVNIRGVEFLPDGELVLVASFLGEVVVEGREPPVVGADRSLLIVRYSRTGEVRWVATHPVGEMYNVFDSAVALSGELLVVGSLAGDLDLGDQHLSSVTQSGFLSRFSLDDGAPVETDLYRSTTGAAATGVAVGPGGVVGVVGYYVSDLDPEPGAPPELGGGGTAFRMFLLMVDGDGTYRCAFTPAPEGDGVTAGTGIAFHGAQPVVVGTFSGSADFGTGTQTSSGADAFVSEQDENCQPSGRSYFLGGGNLGVGAVAVTGDDFVVVGGGTIELRVEGETYGLPPIDIDPFLVRYSAAGADVSLVRGSGADFIEDVVALGGSSDVLVGGQLGSNDLELDGRSIDLLGPRDGFVVRVDPFGAAGSLRQIGGGDDALVKRVAFSPTTGWAAASGVIQGPTTFPELDRNAPAEGSSFVYVFVP